MDLGRLRKGEWLAGLSGLALLIAMLVSWYDRPDAVNAWEAFSFLDILLALTALAGLAVAVLAAANRAPALPVASAVAASGLGIVMTLVVLYRVLNQPGPNDLVDVRAGALLGLLAVLGVAAGGWLTMADERTEIIEPPHVPAQPPPPATAAEGSVVARGEVPDAAPQGGA